MITRIILIALIFAFFPHWSVQVGFIQPITPLEPTFVNTQLPSIYTFYYNLTSGLRSDAYIRIQFPNYTTLGTPVCLFSVNQTTARDTIDCFAISNSVYIQPTEQLTSDDSIHTTIFLSQRVPNLPGYTDLFEISTVSSTDTTTAVIFDINPGFGNMFWQPYSNVGRLFVQQISQGPDANLQGAINSISVHIRFNQGFTADYARLIVILDRPWAFENVTLSTEKSPLYAIAVAQGQPTDLYLATSIKSFFVQNDQILQIYFNESLATGREFILNIDGIRNPLSISQGKIRFYSTEYTSNYALEANENIGLSTAENNLDVEVTLASGIPFMGPVALYKGAQQYVKISFLVDADLPEGAKIVYQFSRDSIPINGTFYIAPTLQGLNNGTINYVIGNNTITMTNLGPMAAGTIISIQIRMNITKIWPQFYSIVSLFYDDTIIRFGESTPIDLITNANSIITYFGDQNQEEFVIETSSDGAELMLNLQTTTKEVTTNATLYIYGTKFINGPTDITCATSSSTPFSLCNFTNNGNYSEFIINTIPVSTNLNINITGLSITTSSSHEEAIYEFYMRLDKDGSGTEYQDLMIFAFVRPPRNVLSSFLQSHISNIGANTQDNFPNFIRMYGSQSALSSLRISDEEDLVLTVYSLNSISNNLDVNNSESFPCGGSLTIQCEFIQGSSSPEEEYPLDWSRVVITLPNAIVNNPFNFYIPQFFVDYGAQKYEFMIGTYNRDTRIYTNLYIQNQYVATPTQDTDLFNQLNVTSDLYVDISGQQAGVLVASSIPVSFVTNMTVGTGAGAATVLVTAWEFWNDASLLSKPASPLSTLPQDATVFLAYKTPSNSPMNAVIWPMTGSGVQNSVFQALNVEMPYSLDIPNYIMYVTDITSNVYAYNSLINTGRNALSSTVMTDFSFSCNDMVQGYLNTYCSIIFTPNAKIDLETKAKIQFSNAFVTISQCSITYQTQDGVTHSLTSSNFTCSSSLSEILLAFTLEERLPVASYNFSFLGFDHQTGSDNSMNFTIFDDNFGYVIETATYNYFLELKLVGNLQLNNLNYDFINLDSISNLRISFTLPRAMYSNEVLEFDIGADLQGNNKNTKRLAVYMTDATDLTQRINIFGALKNQILRIQFDEGVLLSAGSYILNIDNLRTPSTHSTDQIKIRVRRETDSVFTLETNSTVFTAYPVLQLATSAQLKLLRSRFLCTGCLGEFMFQVTLSKTYLDQYTKLYLHMPSFFLPALANDKDQPDCWFNKDPINCVTDPDYPYRIDLSNAPLVLKPGAQFNLTIYGFIVPNAGIPADEEEDIFFALYTPSSPGTYSEQTFLSLPQLSLIQSGLAPMFFYALNVSNTTIKQNSDYVLRVNTSAAIPQSSQVTVTFTEDFVNLRYLNSVSCALNIWTSDTKILNFTNANCDIVGATIQFNVTKDIASSSSLELTILSIPNPVQAMVVDPNEFVIAAFKSDGVTMIAVSKDSLNSVYDINFVNPMNILQANNNLDIMLTRGTYTDYIQIGTAGGERFIQDVSINATTIGFVFQPFLLNFYVGDISSTFRVGCDQNIKVRTYPFNFTLDQDVALVNAYGDTFNVRVTVTDDQIEIPIPDTITIPLGGYSVPYQINLQQLPFRNMQILTIINEDIYNGAFGFDADYSSAALNFSSTKGIGYLAFYSTQAITKLTTPFYVNLTLDGDNFEAYQLSRNQIKIVIDSTSTIGSPNITGSIESVGKTEALFSLNYETKGMALFQLSQPCASFQGFNLIKNLLRNNSFNDLEVNDGCYQRYFSRVLDDETTPYSLNISGLVPETKYTLYVFFENQLKQNNTNIGLNFTFTTSNLDSIVKMTAKFSTSIYIDQLNDFICFLLRLFQTRATYVVDAQGYSCSSYIEPTSRFLTFQGDSYANYSQSFNFYLLPDPTVEIDASSLTLPNYFNLQTKKALANFYTEAKNEGINFLSQFSIDYNFTQEEAFSSSDPIVMPAILGFDDVVEVIELNGTIKMTNIQLSAEGTVYAIAREIGVVIPDPEDDFSTTDIPVRNPRTPTHDQINNCVDWNNEPADACAKAVIANDDDVTLSLKDLKPNTLYIVYYTVANEYPIKPIFSSDIESFTAKVLWGGILSSSLAIVISFIVLVF